MCKMLWPFNVDFHELCEDGTRLKIFISDTKKINLEILETANKFGMPYLMVGPGTTLEKGWKLSVGIDTR